MGEGIYLEVLRAGCRGLGAGGRGTETTVLL